MKIPKIFLVAIMLISVLTLSICLCACKNDNNEQPPSDDLRNADWIKLYGYPNYCIRPGNYSTVINSVEGIEALCDKDSSQIFEKDNDEQNGKIIEKLKLYDEKFFETKSLVIIFKLQSGGNCYVKDFEIIDDSMNVTLIRETPKGVAYPAIPNTRLYLLELDKEKIQGVTRINAEEIHIVIQK